MAAITVQGNANPTHFIEPNTDGSLAVTAVALPLPAGAATAANQATQITAEQAIQASAASIDTKTPTLVSGRQPVDGSGVTQPVSAAALPLPTGAATSALQTTGNASLATLVTNSPALVSGRAPVDPSGVTSPVQEVAAALAQTGTAASGTGVTVTLPAVAAQFHYITMIEIVRYAAAALTGSATPLLVTTTNLPGSPVFDFQTAGAIGTSERQLWNPNKALKSSVVNTATTIVCPATTGVIWRVNVWYVAAP